MKESVPYPVRLTGEFDPATSRWLWLGKWLLVIPHAIVLAFLWLAAIALSIVAGFAILLTARYPRAIFDFNVGVMRWTWRVSFYALGAFGTDRSPPFSLHPDATYPAGLDVAYPQRLNRWQVLVKWWLLALPQYVVVAIFAGGWHDGVGVGLIGLLALIAGVVLLFTGRYPASIFELVMGLNRWCYRVLAYAALMTDEYPPFRLDMGGADPATEPARQRAPNPLEADHGGSVGCPAGPQDLPERQHRGRGAARSRLDRARR